MTLSHNKSPDLRVVKTHKVIREAFIMLLSEQEYNDITMLPARFWEGSYLSSVAVKPPTSGGGYKAIVKCDEFCYTHLTIFNVLHSTVKLRLNCEYAVT